MLEERGGYIIVVSRFIPGGRTVITFTAGFVDGMPWRRFIRYDVIAGVIWGTYTVMLGYVGGKTFEEQPWKGLSSRSSFAARSSRGWSSSYGISVAAAPTDEASRDRRDRPPRVRARPARAGCVEGAGRGQ